MVFSSVTFLFWFLPLVLVAYFIAPRPWRNGVLLFASLVFYTWGGGAMVLLLFVSIVADYVCGRLAARGLSMGDDKKRRLAVAGSVVVNLALLGYFKYANFLVDQLNTLGEGWGFGVIAWESVALPIGISFFTFQSMTYTLDVAAGRVEPVRSLGQFALYVALFPQLIAGPIVRYREIATELEERHSTLSDVANGVVRFCHGLAKKVIVADAMGAIADPVFALRGDDLTMSAAWVGVFAYSMQIYFDFSGYSDMAIGLGRIFGFTFPENFLRPYSAVSITDFWRRWHVTLSRWFRDYLYLPLGGSRGSGLRTHFNLGAVFLLCGLWHGANWTFVVWGAYHGLLLVFERMTGQRSLEAVGRVPLRRAVTFLLVLLGWVVFRADDLSSAMAFYRAMFSFDARGFVGMGAAVLTHRNVLILLLASSVVFLPGSFSGFRLLLAGEDARRPFMARLILLLVLLPYAILLVAAGSYSPFIYFQF